MFRYASIEPGCIVHVLIVSMMPEWRLEPLERPASEGRVGVLLA